MSTKVLALIGILGVLSGIGVPNAHAQAPDSTLDTQVKRAVHGLDGEGRDGPMAALDRALISLYYEHQAYLEGTQSGAFTPSDDQLSVRDAHVTVDAIAKSRPAALLDSLRTLGLQDGAQAQRLVSGRLPIESLRAAAQLSLLQSMRSAKFRPKMNQGGLRPAPSPEGSETSPSEEKASDEAESEAESQEKTAPSPASEEQPDGSTSREAEIPADPRFGTETSSGEESKATAVADSGANSADLKEPAATGASDLGEDSTGSGETERTEGKLFPRKWTYMVGGIVMLVLGLLVVLRRRT